MRIKCCLRASYSYSNDESSITGSMKSLFYNPHPPTSTNFDMSNVTSSGTKSNSLNVANSQESSIFYVNYEFGYDWHFRCFELG